MAKKNDGWVKVGVCGVDSGQLVITDPCYIDNEVSYDDCRAMNGASKQLKFKLGHEGAGVVFKSGIGDGCYPVYAKFEELEGWGKRIVEVRIDLKSHPLLNGGV